jgi:hypothetical protein
MTEPADTSRAAIWEDFIDMFYAPSDVFRRRAHGSVLIPLVVMTLVMGTLFYLNSGALRPVFEAEFDRQMAVAMRSNPKITPEALEGMRGFAERIGQVGAFVIVPSVIFCIGIVTWLVGKLFDATESFKTALVVAAYAYAPRILESVANGLQGLLLDPEQLNGRFRLSLGPARFLDPDAASPLLLAVVGRTDLVTIWVTVLIAIGLAVTGGLRRGRAALAAALIWLIGALPAALQAIRMM